MSDVLLTGCAPQPLASYLKALAVFRLVSTQVDSGAVGRWTDEGFELRSSLDRDGLIAFFTDAYAPTPILAPWNGGSGFYPKDSKVGLDSIRTSKSNRFALYRKGITAAEAVMQEVGSEKGAVKSDEDARRTKILRLCRNQLPDECVEWFDAAIAISSDGSRAFAPVLGTGGNEGRLDYTNNFMENVAGLLGEIPMKGNSRELLGNALFGTPTKGLQKISVGQYEPGRAGGFNQGQGIESSSVVNPWTAVLTIEGAVSWAGGIYRKQGVSYRSFLCSPFTVNPTPIGFGSAAQKDKENTRAEIWAPIWKRFSEYAEIRGLFREGRAALGTRPAKNGIEFAVAVSSLCVDRGIDSFVRYAMLKRRGDSYNATPLGTFSVPKRESKNADLVRELIVWLDDAERIVKNGGKEAPNSWIGRRRNVEEAILVALMRDTTAKELVECAAAFGAAVRWMCERGIDIQILRRLSSDWIARITNCEEANIAASLASLPDILTNVSKDSPLYSWTGVDLAAKMVNTLRRRTLSGQPLSGQPVKLDALQKFLDEETDDQLIEDLLFAFVKTHQPERTSPMRSANLWPAYCVMKLLFLSVPVKVEGGEISLATSQGGPSALPADLAIPSLLAAGRVGEATAIAVRRLRNVGLRPLEVEYGDVADARRLGAALVIPFDGFGALLQTIAADKDTKGKNYD